ncbi:MAG: DNA polymerase III subunit beta [Victivallaceae bacterium]|nr:DNA polymerase III subunit beta [Victivallaceae bacterium]
MKITVSRDKLQKALQKVGAIISSHSMLPIIGNVLMKADENTVTLTTTDLEVRISVVIDAKVEEVGATTAPAKKLASLVSCLMGEEVYFDSDEKEHIRIKCGTGNFKLLGLPAADFPELEDFEVRREIEIKAKDFKRMIGSISYAVSADDSRKVLTGVLMSVNDSQLTLVATDGKRMAMMEKAPDAVSGGNGDVIVPARAAGELRRMLDGDVTVKVSVGEKLCSFKCAEFILITKLIEGNYPNFKQVIPASFAREIELPSAVLLSKIETVSLVLSNTSAFIVMHFSEGKLEVRASSSEVGEGSDVIDINYSGEEFEASFNPVFISEPLRNCDCDSVKLKLNDPLNPMEMEGGDGFIYIIMPIRKK